LPGFIRVSNKLESAENRVSQLGETYYIYVHGFQAVPSKGFFILTIGEE
jgi:hypothetical protein